MRTAPIIHKYRSILITLSLHFCSWTIVHGQEFFTSTTSTLQEKATALLNNSSLQFRKNEGQWDEQIRYQSSANGANVYFLQNALSFGFKRQAKLNISGPNTVKENFDPTKDQFDYMTWNLNLIGADPRTMILEEGGHKTCVNYLKENKNIKGVTDAEKITYKNIYSNIDLKYYSKGNALEYDYIIHPFGDLSKIKMQCEGIKKLSLTAKGDLIITTSWGDLLENKPFTYQLINGAKKEIKSAFILINDSTYSFKINSSYDTTIDLIIDPVILEWSTFIGGNAPGGGYIFDIAVDAAGFVYATGWYDNGFPTTVGSFGPTYNTPGNNCGFGGGDEDAYVFKMNPSATALIYCTYVGGTCKDRGRGIAINNSGEAFVTGWTMSTDFPTVNPFQTVNNGGVDAFAIRLDASGSNLIYSTYLGGNYNDWAEKIAINQNNEAFLCGACLDNGINPNFPTTIGSIQPNYGGGMYMGDAYVLKLNATGNNLIYSTFLGGTLYDWAYSIRVNASDEAFVCGKAQTGFPTTTGSYQNVCAGNGDAFISRINSTGSALIYSTFIGGANSEVANSIAINANNEAFVTGNTGSANLPTTPGAYDQSYNGSTYGDAFVSKINSSGTILMASTYLGTNQLDIGWGIDVDANNEIFIAGYTEGASFPTTVCAYDNTFNGPTLAPYNADYFFVKFNSTLTTLKYSTFVGGNDQDYWEPKIKLIGTPCDQRAICSGTSHSINFPTTSGVIQPVKLNGSDDQPTVLKFRPKIYPGFTANPNPVCTNVPVTFVDTTSDCGLWGDTLTIHHWDFGDGNQGNGLTITHAYSAAGTYTVQLIVGCPMDTVYQTVIVNQGTTANLSPPPGQCIDGNNFSFNANGTFSNNATFSWSFGLNSTPQTSNQQNPAGIIFSTIGTHTITCSINEPGCGVSTYTITIQVYPMPLAVFTPNPFSTDISNPTIVFTDQSIGSTIYSWNFGDNSTSTSYDTSHAYNAVGDYTVTLFVTNQYGCTDSTVQIIHITDESTLYIPNAFTPNGDGINDIFSVSGTNIETYTLDIFDRWGQNIFHSTSSSWDGRANGGKEIAQEDVYVYLIVFITNTNREITRKGHVSLIK